MKIEVKHHLDAPLADIFETIADVPRWPELIRSVLRTEKLTNGPVGRGTVFRETRVIFNHISTHTMEVVDFDRPHRLRVAAWNQDIHYELDHLMDRVFGADSRILLIFRSYPRSSVGRAVHPFMTPMMEITVRDELERDLADIVAGVKARV
ncbi:MULTISPECIES: SRPBCC family protein [Rhodomicrobium]|uniref:SRPBCC family protein n=1 Tax=Rhodomicrobium TaxID=1068 RepID=UPI000B4AC75E|nr:MULTISPECIES: SRPBCC family protein [Rhodomicrobium]